MSPTVERPVEVELKYRVVDLAAAERYLAAEEIGPFSGTAALRSTQLEDRYVDTADGALGRAGFAVRLRRSGRGTIVSVKGTERTEGPGGSMRRQELEGPADPTAGPLDWPASDARSLVLAARLMELGRERVVSGFLVRLAGPESVQTEVAIVKAHESRSGARTVLANPDRRHASSACNV